MKTILVFILLIFSFAVKAQNLVINGDFELYDQCPTTVGSVNGYLQSGYNPYIEATTDYYNNCDIQPDPCIDFGHVGVPLNSAGYQEAYDGQAYIGIFVFSSHLTNYREYIVLPLSSTLIKDSIYMVSFMVSKAETMGLATDAIMIGFSDTALPVEPIGYGILPISGYKMADFPVEDDENWTLLKKHYKANGTENYLVIGNFLSDTQTLLTTSSFEPFVCTPTSYVGYPNSSYYYIDGVNVKKHVLYEYFPNIFTPNVDGVNDNFSVLLVGYNVISGYIVNRWGEVVYQAFNNEINWDGSFNGNKCAEGVYFYNVLLKDRNSGEIIQKQGFVSLQR